MRKKRVWIGLGLLVLGVVLYFLPVHIEMSGLTAAGYGVLCLFDWYAERKDWGRGWHVAVLAVGIAVSVVLGGATALVLVNGRSQWDEARRADYIVVLGAQVQGDRPSRTLRARLDTALELLEENEEAVCIVSGGQGDDEDATEASVMYAYLVAHGADPERLYREDRSRSTRENLMNAAQIAVSLGLDPRAPALVTSEFHLCRAKYIAGTLGLEAVGVASRTEPWILKFNYALREVFAFVKAWSLSG